MCEDVPDRARYNVDRWRREREGWRKFRRNEEVNKRLGELSNGGLFLRG
jgi:hypothetical protein